MNDQPKDNPPAEPAPELPQTRLKIQLNFEIEGPFTTLDAMQRAGIPFVAEALNGLIDNGAIPGPVKLIDGTVYRRVELSSPKPPRARRRRRQR